MNKLPRNWIEVTLADVTSKGQYGWTTKAANSGLIKYLRITDITHKHINWETVPYCSQTPIDIEKYEVQSGDILIARTGSVGYSILIENVPFRAVFASYLIRFVPSPEVNARYLYHFLQSQNYWHQIYKASSGIAVPNINAKKLAHIILPLAPLNEQKRLADKVDTLLAQVDACRARLERVRVILQHFRQAVLAAATSGELTEDWRKEKGISKLWQTVRLSDVSTSRLGKMLDQSKNQGFPTPYLRNANVRWFDFDLSDIKSIKVTEDERETFAVRQGDVLICEGGEAGRCAVWYGPDSMYVFQKALHRVRVGKELTPEWLCYYLKFAADSGQLNSLFTGTVIKHLTGVSLSKFEFELPPITEQHEIIRRVEVLFAYADQLERHTRVAFTKVEALTPTLLDKAFRGELVPQKPNDEPASVLLERIRAERSKQPNKPKKTRRTKRSKMTKNSVKKAILELPEDHFSSDELRDYVAGDYEQLKDIIFALLDESKPCITQRFDEASQRLYFVRSNK